MTIWCFSSFLKTFKKIEKNWSFCPPRIVNIFGSIHTCAHFSSKWFNFYILVVLKWKHDAFLHFRKLWKKKWSFRPQRTCRHLWLNSHMYTFFIEMSELLYFSCPKVKIWCFSSFSKTFQKIKKIEVFAHHGPVDIFGSIHTCAHFSSKWVTFFILTSYSYLSAFRTFVRFVLV